MRIFFSVLSILASLAFATQAAAIEITNPVALSQPDTTAPGAIGLTIVNKAGADKLVSTKTPVAKIAQIHNNKVKRGKMRMRRKSGLEIGANTVTTLKTDGLHIMLMGLKSPLKTGMTFPLTLNFEKAGTVEVTVTVQ